MGGYGSGRHGRRPDRRRTVEGSPRLPVQVAAIALRLSDPDGAWLDIAAGAHRWTLAAIGPGDAAHLDDDDDADARPPGAALGVAFRPEADDAAGCVVPLVWSRVGFGWRCYWRCPCGRSVVHVYAPDAGRGAWRCRRCARLAYTSTRLAPYARAGRKARAAAAALGARDAWTCTNEDLAQGRSVLPRPYGVHRRTYLRRLGRWIMRRDAFALLLYAELLRGWDTPAMRRVLASIHASADASADAAG